MELKNITFKTEKYKILKGLTLSFKDNEYVGILGSSGAGKTTLLNLASGRVKKDDIKLYNGNIILNDGLNIKKINYENLEFIKKKTGYVYQHDVLPFFISINEYMNFVVDLANNKKKKIKDDKAYPIIKEEKKVLIERILKSLNLDGNRKIENLSGGERKRTAIGLELLHAILTGYKEIDKENNNILFLDEPTTGLDNGTALTVMLLLKSIEGLRICTIHQPTPRILNLFDRIIILNNGKIFFNGTPKELKINIEEIGINCIEDVVDVVFTDVLPEIKWEGEICKYKGKIIEFKTNLINNNNKTFINETINNNNIEKERRSFFKELKILLNRLFKTFKNKPFILVSRVVQSLIISLVLSPIFYNLNAPKLLDLNSQIVGFFYQCTLNIFYSAGMGSINLIYENYELFKREYQHNYYSVTTYYFTKVIEGCILYSFLPIISPPLMLLATRIPMTISRFLIFSFINWIISMCGLAIALFFGSIFEDQQYALISLSLTLLPLATISGLLVDPNQLIFFLKKAQYISPPRYAFNAQIKNYFLSINSNETDRKRIIYKENSPLITLREEFVGIPLSICMLLTIFFLLIFSGLLIFKRRVKRA